MDWNEFFYNFFMKLLDIVFMEQGAFMKKITGPDNENVKYIISGSIAIAILVFIIMVIVEYRHIRRERKYGERRLFRRDIDHFIEHFIEEKPEDIRRY